MAGPGATARRRAGRRCAALACAVPLLAASGCALPLGPDRLTAPEPVVVTVTESAPDPSASAETSTTSSAGPTAESAPPRSWPDLYDAVSGGVARIATVTCDGGGSGSGFLVGPGLVATAAHVVDGASSLSLRFGPDVFVGEVVLLAEDDDLALVRVDGTPGAHRFRVADGPARTGEDVAVLGYPFGRPLAMTQGAVTSVDVRHDVEGRDLRGLFRTDSAINSGNSGGPVVGADGEVVGVVVAGSDAAGDGLAASQPALRGLLDRWDADGDQPVAPVECAGAGGNPFGLEVDVAVSSDDPEAASIAQTMQLYADSINSGYYELTWELLTASMRQRFGSLEEYSAGLDTSYWLSIDVRDVRALDDRTDEAVVAFRTVQDAEFGPDGQTCSDWLVTYTFALDEGYWQIDGAQLEDGPAQPCPADEAEALLEGWD